MRRNGLGDGCLAEAKVAAAATRTHANIININKLYRVNIKYNQLKKYKIDLLRNI
jgi:hypothetical protein